MALAKDNKRIEQELRDFRAKEDPHLKHKREVKEEVKREVK